jgi:hypothetical protein
VGHLIVFLIPTFTLVETLRAVIQYLSFCGNGEIEVSRVAEVEERVVLDHFLGKRNVG